MKAGWKKMIQAIFLAFPVTFGLSEGSTRSTPLLNRSRHFVVAAPRIDEG